MKPIAAGLFVGTVVLGNAGAALAVPPSIQSLTVKSRHPAITFSAPRADNVFVSFSSKADRATDGSFLQENIVAADSFTDDEIQSGQWSDASQLDPGTYYVLLDASPSFDEGWQTDLGDYDPACANGYSATGTLVVPRPVTKYVVSVTRFKFLKVVDLKLTASPLGVATGYKVCYLTKTRARRCVNGTLTGYSWNSPADDTLHVSTRSLAASTRFTWLVAGTLVASRTIRTD